MLAKKLILLVRSVYTSRLYKSLESGNGTKISDEKWRLVKPKYLRTKNDKKVL